MKKAFPALLAILFCMTGINAVGQQKIDLAGELQQGKITAVNRAISPYTGQPGAVEMSAARGDGLAILEGVEFTTGVIEVELLGENAPGMSFIGIAFNIQDEETYEAVYFRPFNFVAQTQLQKDHMVQYISHPDNSWNRLREERTGEFEHEILPPPDPDEWFRIVIEISDDEVAVMVDRIALPVLEVKRLTGIKSKKIGLWTGNGSSGRFKSLTVSQD